MKLITLIILLGFLAFIGYIGYIFFFKKAENFLDINAKIPVYHYKFELPKQPEIMSLELDVESVAKAAESVQFKRSDPSGYLKNMCTYRQENREENCNSLVGVTPRPMSSAHPQMFTQF